MLATLSAGPYMVAKRQTTIKHRVSHRKGGISRRRRWKLGRRVWIRSDQWRREGCHGKGTARCTQSAVLRCRAGRQICRSAPSDRLWRGGLLTRWWILRPRILLRVPRAFKFPRQPLPPSRSFFLLVKCYSNRFGHRLMTNFEPNTP